MSMIEEALIAFIDKTTNEVVVATLVPIDGSTNIELSKGSYRVIVAKKGYHVYEDEIEVTEDITLNITLQKITGVPVGVLVPRVKVEKPATYSSRTTLTPKLTVEVTSS